MDCGRFGKLIDTYLDGQLAGSLLAEFHAHRLACRRCSRVVSMLQAAGDVIAHDHCGEPKISTDFADRIVLALPGVTQKANRSLWMVRLTAGAGTLAAAAAIVMAVILSNQVPNHRPGTAVLSRVARSNDSDIGMPNGVDSVVYHEAALRDRPMGNVVTCDARPLRNPVSIVHHAIASQSDLLPSESDLLTGNAFRGAVDRVVGWTEYRLKGGN